MLRVAATAQERWGSLWLLRGLKGSISWIHLLPFHYSSGFLQEAQLILCVAARVVFVSSGNLIFVTVLRPSGFSSSLRSLIRLLTLCDLTQPHQPYPSVLSILLFPLQYFILTCCHLVPRRVLLHLTFAHAAPFAWNCSLPLLTSPLNFHSSFIAYSKVLL